MTLLRRFLVCLTLMFWLGGSAFYGAVVVPTGRDVLGSDLDQGWITQRVTNWMNLAALPCLLVWAWEIASPDNPSPQLRRRWLLWTLVASALPVLYALHVQMDLLLDQQSREVLDLPRFRNLHRWYLRIISVQWIAALGLLWQTLGSWQSSTGGHKVCKP